MRLLLVNAHGSDLAAGGAERYVSELASGFERRGDTAFVLSAFPSRVRGFGRRTFVLHATDWRDDKRRRIKNHLGDLLSKPSGRLRDAVRTINPDLVHTNNLPGLSTAIWEVCRRLRIPVVHTIHDYYLLCPRVTLARRDGTSCCAHATFCKTRTARLMRWSAGVGDVITVSDHVRRRHAGLFEGARFHVVRIPVTPRSNERFTAPRKPPKTIGYLGVLETAKGIEHLVEAAPALADLGYVVQIAGDGRLRDLVEEAALRGQVRYHERVHGDEKARFIESTDLAVVPSRWEEPGGPPYSIAEWLAAGRPVIASRRGGLAELPHLFDGVIPMDGGAAGIVAAVRGVADRWREVVATVDGRDGQAMDGWLDRHREVYELALEQPRQPR